MNRPVKLTPTIEARRQDLIQGTIRSISQLGYANSTVQTICDAAGLSRGLIGHYFNGKDDLFLHAFRHITKRLDEQVRDALLKVGKDPFRRLLTVATITFSDEAAKRQNAPVWLAFWGVARWNADMIEVHRTLYGRYRRWIEKMMVAAAAERGLELDPRHAAIAFTQLADGLWFGWIMEEDYTMAEAQLVLRQWLFQTFREDPGAYADLDAVLSEMAPAAASADQSIGR
ncbi:TetR/AcrR family transcriptional repressor of bet genes [Rhodoligotrophos appendicifer]|uniref:TetR family transcriptional regulator C-terminal domain-containing protein n=1 Tax=Rhodoligotrophos appendicifer TaxID=987056 RepID=UPI00147963E3|nr:TetR family transcriptional regulator C-terminal domain-containing protein [Rhodoligotrophos appendicifer]